ncbi:hypothetical protein AAFF_G00216470 [Aldrovandia affinis]|uniref:Uncharacterized protein n=1 Tax=Aldrovandia affinis TaxID=143900 RepID=A0AAD7RJ17_9TELE|nr:hypothetical protein AAFF_G00216470 [Aldrovandia affinis]
MLSVSNAAAEGNVTPRGLLRGSGARREDAPHLPPRPNATARGGALQPRPWDLLECLGLGGKGVESGDSAAGCAGDQRLDLQEKKQTAAADSQLGFCGIHPGSGEK